MVSSSGIHAGGCLPLLPVLIGGNWKDTRQIIEEKK